MQTRSFTKQCERTFGPEPSLVPLFIEALETGQRGGSDSQDVFATTLRESSPELVDRILKGWKRMSTADQARMSASGSRGVRNLKRKKGEREASWDERVRARAAEYEAYHESIAQFKRRLIKAEVRRALEVGVANWTPTDEVRANKSLLYEATHAVWDQLTASPCGDLNVDGDPPPKPKYALRLNWMQCIETDEVGHDEVYVVSVVVDGAGTIRAETSPKFSMNDSDDDIAWPAWYMYPGTDPGGFLDLAFELWEDDGGYGAAVAAIEGVAASIAAAGAATGNPYVIGAGVAIGIIGGLVGLAGLLQDNDRYGRVHKVWTSAPALAAAVGSHTFNFVNLDEGYFDFTQWNYSLQIELVATSGA